MNINIRRVYLYLTSLIGLVLVLIGGVQMVNLGLKTWVFTKADDAYYGGVCYELRPAAPVKDDETPRELSKEDCEKQRAEERTARRQSDAAQSVAFVLVGLPVWMYHWGKVKNEWDTAVQS